MSEPLQVTHVFPRLGMTGPVLSLAAMVRHAQRLGLDQSHRVLTLEPGASPLAVQSLRRHDIACDLAPGDDAIADAIADAEVVVLHWWSCPSVAQLLLRPLPACRLAIAVHVHGGAPPQVLTRGVVDAADTLLVTTAGTLELPVFHEAPPEHPPVVVQSVIDPDRLEQFERVPHDGVVVGYLGTVNRAKLHPDFVELCAAVPERTTRFLVVGSGGEGQVLRDQAVARGLGDRFEVRGFTEDVAAALAEMDVFGYPLRVGTSASAEVALQEAMWVGLPPVVFPHGGVRHLVEDGETGLVAHSADEYAEHVGALVRDPGLRTRLGARARAHARTAFDPTPATRAADAALRATVALDARSHPVLPWGPTPGEWFAHSLGAWGELFLRDLATPGAPENETAIATIDPAVAGGEGGLYQWCNAFPDDPALRRWTRIRGGASTP